MSCECPTPFNKLRECWSRHHKKNMQGECECCSVPKSKSKVKGKFGIAYVINTPNRKCKPCGWEVEFNDTLSEVENNCKKMMHWVTCPPLGECQNNQTNMCRCSEDAKKLLNNNTLPNCSQCTRKDDELCRCCKEKNRKSEGDSCCKKEQRPCCARPAPKNQCLCQKANDIKSQCCLRTSDNKNQCCCKTSNNKNPCCSKSKQKSGCRGALDGQTMYLESIKRCTECCCIIPNTEKDKQCFCKPQEDKSDEECCCKETKKKLNCCCHDNDSQSSLDSCECNNQSNRKCCCCNCNCTGCKSNGRTRRDKRKKQKHEENKKDDRQGKTQLKEMTGSKDKEYTKPKPSKNLQSPEPKTKRYKGTEKTPFTLITHKVPKKEPDTGQEHVLKGFYDELHERIQTIKNPGENTAEQKQDSISNLKVIVDQKDSIPEYNSTRTSLEKDAKVITNSTDNRIEENEVETEINRIVYDDKNVGANISPSEVANPENVPNEDVNKDLEINPSRKKKNSGKRSGKRPTMLQQIKRAHKKEIEAVHPKQEIEAVVEKQVQRMMDRSPEKPKTKNRIHHGPALLKKIKQKRKTEMEAIHPKQHEQKNLIENTEKPEPIIAEPPENFPLDEDNMIENRKDD